MDNKKYFSNYIIKANHRQNYILSILVILVYESKYFILPPDMNSVSRQERLIYTYMYMNLN